MSTIGLELAMTLLYGESTSQRCGLPQRSVAQYSVPLFVTADAAQRLGLVAIANALRAGESITLRTGSAVVTYSGNSRDVVKELESATTLMHVAARFLDDEFDDPPCLFGVQWFVKHDKSDFRLVVGKATTHTAHAAVAFFGDVAAAAPANCSGVTTIHATAQTIGFGPINEVSGRSAAGVVARAAMRVFGWDHQRLLALFSSQSCPFVLQCVDKLQCEKYRAFLDDATGLALFPRREKVPVTDGSEHRVVREYLRRMDAENVEPSQRADHLDVYYPTWPDGLLAVCSVEPGVAEHAVPLVRQVLHKHRRDDLRVAINFSHALMMPTSAAIILGTCSVRDALGKCPPSAVEYVDLRQYKFKEHECSELVRIAAAASLLEIVVLDRATGVSRECVEQLLLLPHIRVVSIVGTAVAGEFDASDASDKLIVDRGAARHFDEGGARFRYINSVIFKITQNMTMYRCSRD
jgi:hypothetical protein